jgi:glycosyltransferase involved in cell wall biosynthesis
MDHEKIVSVGVPVFNGERFLRNALQSLLDQDYPYLEIIISDNSSTDGTANICKEFMSKDKRIKYSRNSCNIGGAANFNKLIDAASGEYFMWFACDDLLKQNYVSKLVQLLDDKSNSIAFCIPNAIDENGKFLGDAPKFKQLVGKNKFDGLCRFLLQGEIWGKANITYGLMRRKQIQKTKGFKTWGWGEWGGDMHLVFNLLTMGKLVLQEEILFYKRITGYMKPTSQTAPKTPYSGVKTALRYYKSTLNLFKIKLIAEIKSFFMFSGYLVGYVQIAFQSDLNLFQKFILSMLCLYRAIIYPVRKTG